MLSKITLFLVATATATSLGGTVRMPFSKADIIECIHEITTDKIHSYSYVNLNTPKSSPGLLEHVGVSMEKHGLASDPNVCVELDDLAKGAAGFVDVEETIYGCNHTGFTEYGILYKEYREWLWVTLKNGLKFASYNAGPYQFSGAATCN